MPAHKLFLENCHCFAADIFIFEERLKGDKIVLFKQQNETCFKKDFENAVNDNGWYISMWNPN